MKFNNLFRTKDTFQTYSLDTNRYVLTDLRKHLTSCHILVEYMEHLIIKSNTRKDLSETREIRFEMRYPIVLLRK